MSWLVFLALSCPLARPYNAVSTQVQARSYCAVKR